MKRGVLPGAMLLLGRREGGTGLQVSEPCPLGQVAGLALRQAWLSNHVCCGASECGKAKGPLQLFVSIS